MIPEEISVVDFKRRLDAGEALVILDVREPFELAAAQIPYPVLHVPMNDVPARLDEIPKDRNLVVMCHGGVRSDHVASYLRARGYDAVANLAGGIDAYARFVDANVPTY